MGTTHAHTITCPHCGNVTQQLMCSLNSCHFPEASREITEYPELDTCHHCGMSYSFDDGCWSGLTRLDERDDELIALQCKASWYWYDKEALRRALDTLPDPE